MPDNQAPFQPPQGETQRYKRGYLPHLERGAATYFVTFRTADSLPANVVAEMRARKLRLHRAANSDRELLPIESVNLKKLSNVTIEQFLDKAHGSCPMLRPEVANVVANALKFWDGERYKLFAWAVMPNHVHIVLSMSQPQSLASIIGSWKSFSANRANKCLGRVGLFWQREYFDRVLRDQSQFYRAIEYVVQNPSIAGLEEWPWVWRRSDA